MAVSVWFGQMTAHAIKHSAPYLFPLFGPCLRDDFSFTTQLCWTLRAPTHWPIAYSRFRMQSWMHLCMVPIPGARAKRTVATHMFDVSPCLLCGDNCASSPMHLLGECAGTMVLRAILWAQLGVLEPPLRPQRYLALMAPATLRVLHFAAGLCATIGAEMMAALQLHLRRTPLLGLPAPIQIG